MKDVRSLVMEITSKGAALYDLIKEEGEIRVNKMKFKINTNYKIFSALPTLNQICIPSPI